MAAGSGSGKSCIESVHPEPGAGCSTMPDWLTTLSKAFRVLDKNTQCGLPARSDRAQTASHQLRTYEVGRLISDPVNFSPRLSHADPHALLLLIILL